MPSTIAFNDIMTLISDYALALRSDSSATDSTLDSLQRDLDLIFAHDAFDDDDTDELLTPDRATFDAACFADIDPDLSRTTIDTQIADLAQIATNLINLRP